VIGGQIVSAVGVLASSMMLRLPCEPSWIAAEVSRLEVLIQRCVSSCRVSKAPEQAAKEAEMMVSRQVPE
jgi:hypothetical protein